MNFRRESLESRIVDHVGQVRFQDLDDDIIANTKLFILDTIGVALAGIRAPGCEIILDYVIEQGGRPDCSIWGYDRKVSPEQAALINGTFAHSLDLDDTFVPGGLHTNAVVLPAAFAVAEKKTKISGREFLTAIAVGVDLACRLSLAGREGGNLGWWPTSIFTSLGGSAAVAKILGLEREGIYRALGVAYSQLMGNRQPVLDGGLTKRLQCGLTARAVVSSGYLAQRGISGAIHFLTGRFGLFDLYAQGGCNPRHLMEGLGERYYGNELLCKLYPACSGAQGPIQATLELVHEHRLRPEDVKSVKVFVPPEVAEQLGGPFKMGDEPQVEAQFNLSYLVAAAIVNKQLTVYEIETKRIREDKVVIETAARVSIVPQDMVYTRNVELPITVRIETIDGQHLSSTLHHIWGELLGENRRGDITNKFSSCLDYAGGGSLEEFGEIIIDRTMHLEELKTLEDWFSSLTAVQVRS